MAVEFDLKNIPSLILDAIARSLEKPPDALVPEDLRLVSLQSLYIFQAPVSDLTPLAGLNDLRDLWLRGTQVSEIAPLSGLTSLETLALGETRVTEDEKQKLETILTQLEIVD